MGTEGAYLDMHVAVFGGRGGLMGRGLPWYHMPLWYSGLWACAASGLWLEAPEKWGGDNRRHKGMVCASGCGWGRMLPPPLNKYHIYAIHRRDTWHAVVILIGAHDNIGSA